MIEGPYIGVDSGSSQFNNGQYPLYLPANNTAQQLLRQPLVPFDVLISDRGADIYARPLLDVSGGGSGSSYVGMTLPLNTSNGLPIPFEAAAGTPDAFRFTGQRHLDDIQFTMNMIHIQEELFMTARANMAHHREQFDICAENARIAAAHSRDCRQRLATQICQFIDSQPIYPPTSALFATTGVIHRRFEPDVLEPSTSRSAAAQSVAHFAGGNVSVSHSQTVSRAYI